MLFIMSALCFTVHINNGPLMGFYILVILRILTMYILYVQLYCTYSSRNSILFSATASERGPPIPHATAVLKFDCTKSSADCGERGARALM